MSMNPGLSRPKAGQRHDKTEMSLPLQAHVFTVRRLVRIVRISGITHGRMSVSKIFKQFHHRNKQKPHKQNKEPYLRSSWAKKVRIYFLGNYIQNYAHTPRVENITAIDVHCSPFESEKEMCIRVNSSNRCVWETTRVARCNRLGEIVRGVRLPFLIGTHAN